MRWTRPAVAWMAIGSRWTRPAVAWMAIGMAWTRPAVAWMRPAGREGRDQGQAYGYAGLTFMVSPEPESPHAVAPPSPRISQQLPLVPQLGSPPPQM